MGGAEFWRWLAAGMAMVAVPGCAVLPATPPSTSGLVPRPPGWFAFCAAHDPASPLCDPVPMAAAMPDGSAAPPPRGWQELCRRTPGEPGCPAS